MKYNVLLGIAMMLTASNSFAIASSIPNIKSSQELTNKMKDGKITVLEFWAPWCPHCKSFNISGKFERAAEKHTNVNFLRANSEDAQSLHQAHGIKAYPTFIFFKDGKEVMRQTGRTCSSCQ